MSGFFLIFSQLIFGAGVYQLFSKEEKLRMGHWIFGYPLGAYLYTQIIFFEGIFGIPLTAKTYIVTSLFMLIMSTPFLFFVAKGNDASATFLRFKDFPLESLKTGFKKNPQFLLILFISILFGSTCLFNTYYVDDSLYLYFGKGSVISIDNGFIWENLFRTCGVSTNPLFLPIQYASFLSTGFNFPEVMFGIFYLITVLTIFWGIMWFSPQSSFLQNGWIAFGCAFIFAISPTILTNASTALANLPYAAYFILSVLLMALGMKREEGNLFYLSVMMFTGAIWAYAYGPSHYLLIFLSIVTWALLHQRQNVFVISFIVTMLLWLPWPLYRVLHWREFEKALLNGQGILSENLSFLQRIFPYADVIWILFYFVAFLLILLFWKKLITLFEDIGKISFYIPIITLMTLFALLYVISGRYGYFTDAAYDLSRLIAYKDWWGILFISFLLSTIIFRYKNWGGIFLLGGIIALLINAVNLGIIYEMKGIRLPVKLTNIFYHANRNLIPISAVIIMGFGILLNNNKVKVINAFWGKLIPIVVITIMVVAHLWTVPHPTKYINSAWGYAKREGFGNHEIFIERALRQPVYKVIKWMAENTSRDSQLVTSRRDYPTRTGRHPALLTYGGFKKQAPPIMHPRIVVWEDYDQVVHCLANGELDSLKGPDNYPNGYRVYCDQDNVYLVGKGIIQKLKIDNHWWFMPKVECGEG